MKKKERNKKECGVNSIFIVTVLESDEINLLGNESLIIDKFVIGKVGFRTSDFKKALEKKFNVKNQTKTEKAIAKKIIKQVLKDVKSNPQIKFL